MAPSKNIKITEKQKEILLDYMCHNAAFATNKYTDVLGREKDKKMWEELAAMLNSQVYGATKDPSNWKDTWCGWKSKTKSKAREIMAYSQGTGRGRVPPAQLTDIEKRLLDFIGEGVLAGMKNIPELGLPILKGEEEEEEEDQEEDVPFETIECTIDTYDADLNSNFGDDSLHSTTSAQPNGSCSLTLLPITVASGPKRKYASKPEGCEGSKRFGIEESEYAKAAGTFSALEERKLAAAEDTARSVAALVALCERHADAAERTAGAAERRARAAERMADAAERRALVAECVARKTAK